MPCCQEREGRRTKTVGCCSWSCRTIESSWKAEMISEEFEWILIEISLTILGQSQEHQNCIDCLPGVDPTAHNRP